MPTVHRIDAHKIQVFSGDHAPPHFHVFSGGCCDYQVSLESLGIVRGNPCARHSEVIVWAKDNLETLWRIWREQNESG